LPAFGHGRESPNQTRTRPETLASSPNPQAPDCGFLGRAF
jgi:hypothetical protein